MVSKRVTINDVAAAAGVSRQTVTRAMNSMSEITPETRERVLRVSEDLGYRPSRFASNLARQKHHSVALVVATLRNPYYTDLAADVLEEAAARGWQTTIATVEGTQEERVVAQLSTQVDAIVGYFEAPVERLRRAARGVPLIFIERHVDLPGTHSVSIDFDQGMSELVRQLRGRGSKRIAMIDSERAGPPYVPSPRREMLERLIGIDDFPVVVAPETLQGAAVAFSDLWSREPRVDTVVAFNDLMAMGAMQAAHALGLSIPEAVKVVGIDGLSLGAAMYPPLSTLAIDRQAVSQAIADIVAECLRDDVATSSRSIVPFPLWRMSA